MFCVNCNACSQAPDGKIYYFDAKRGTASWMHPSDTMCKQLVQRELARWQTAQDNGVIYTPDRSDVPVKDALPAEGSAAGGDAEGAGGHCATRSQALLSTAQASSAGKSDDAEV